MRDPLTGLHNRRHLDARLQELLGDLADHRTPVTLGLVDLDHFKRINDTRSHAVGDEVLRRIAVLLQASAEQVEGGLAARMGGEEFLVLLPGVGREEGLKRLEVLRSEIAVYDWDEVTDGVPVTASIGLAGAPDDAEDREALLSAADACSTPPSAAGGTASSRPSRRVRPVWVGLRGLEPLTSSLSGKRSNRLSYRPASHRPGKPGRRERLPHRGSAAQTGRPVLATAQRSSSARVTSRPPSSAAARL